MAADLVVLGPGSWFTSVIPHVLVPGLAAALRAATARARRRCSTLAAEPGETAGFSVERHLHVLAQHAPGFRWTRSSSTPSECPVTASESNCDAPRALLGLR